MRAEKDCGEWVKPREVRDQSKKRTAATGSDWRRRRMGWTWCGCNLETETGGKSLGLFWRKAVEIWWIRVLEENGEVE
ncbi:hypothetical protein RchiOBHm_Chr7g0227241 [Rosa chinensis]|uniref:Uncharacterized protein n=1 Tax=Rosa chinensis TaxID=74649 RepID=A0A2P6PEK1_ROSCH|nr:hypothetical protein RchiOBHm_Chr7g0227241 [Rosa chinensis]